MKKKVLVLLCLAFVAVLAQSLFGVSMAAEAEKDYKNTESYIFLKEFITACPNRNGADEKKAADWLADKFGKVCGVEVKPTPFGSGNTVYGYNVEVTLKASEATDKQVIIGAHFDSVGEGANDNASGITAMYLAMKQLVGAKLPFNVVFVAFGGEEQGLLGAQHYVDNMSSVARQNTLVMFNLDSVGGGDNLYIFCENKKTDLADIIIKNASGVQLTEKPHAVGIYPFDYYGYGYFETIQASDHTPFRTIGIPTALFFSGNFAWWNYVESVDESKNVMNSNADKLSKMEEDWGAEFFRKTETVVATLCATLSDENFLSVAENAQNQLLNNALFFNVVWALLMVVALVGLVFLFGWLHYRKLQKKAILGTAEAKEKREVFKKPDAEEVFTFDDDKR